MNLLFANDKAGEYPQSYYAATRADLAPFPELRGATRADVCIIGGGYTGLSAALHLAQRGMDVVLLEAHRVGFGASGRNGGQVGSGQRLEQDELEKLVGLDRARQLWDLSEEAKGMVKSLIREHAMPCTFHNGIAHACWSRNRRIPKLPQLTIRHRFEQTGQVITRQGDKPDMLSLQLDRLYIQHSCSLFEIFYRYQHGNTQTLNRH